MLFPINEKSVLMCLDSNIESDIINIMPDIDAMKIKSKWYETTYMNSKAERAK